MNVNPLPPTDRQEFWDSLRNFFYPTATFAAIAIVWGTGWACSIEAKANLGYWSAVKSPCSTQTICDQNAAHDTEHQSQLASISDDTD